MQRPILHLLIALSLFPGIIGAQLNTSNPFNQLNELLPTANNYRTASGAPGHEYYQQNADYTIQVELDDVNHKIYGEETITFHNNSPDVLNYMWLQLDQNQKSADSDSHKINPQSLNNQEEISSLKNLKHDFDGGFQLEYVKDLQNKDLAYFINKTMMRIDLPVFLKKGESFSFKIKYWYHINDRIKLGGRSGYEYFKEDGNYLYTIAQFFPRMCAYNDIEGWQNKQFLGSGEFTLIFGNYTVSITVPADHLVAATGTLVNKENVLNAEQKKRLEKAANSFQQPIIIATETEARDREKQKLTTKKTWIFKAENVRDFAFASSRKFIWDAMSVKIGDKKIMAMSMYPKEGNPLWEKYSTKTIAHTLKTYSKYTIDYPYPVAWSINADRIGMEYPMISFNFGRCEKDGTYSERTKYGMISVIIHEVGHNFFPMIINSDERQWAWMDEGLTTFLQYLTEQEFERNYPSNRGEPYKITEYMAGDKSKMSPIMINPESAYQLGNNAYAKPATALNILRETIMGRTIFDKAFKEYARRWAFKQPYPADFFRTMEDASGTDLDWFWRGWFYTTDHVDISISNIKNKKITDKDPVMKKEMEKSEHSKNSKTMSSIKNKMEITKTYTEMDTTLQDFYSKRDKYQADEDEVSEYKKSLLNMSEEELKILNQANNYYEIEFERIGGLVMPIIYELHFEDGSTELIRIPAEIWRKGETKTSRVHVSDKRITKVVLDPYLETADINKENNHYPREEQFTRFEVFKRNNQPPQENLMRKENKKQIKP